MTSNIEALRAALAAGPTPGPHHVYTHPRDDNNWRANQYWHQACWPQYVAELLAEVDRLKAEREALRAALEQYANPMNWNEDRAGVRRVWLEPESSTPAAYNGFELARAALKEQA